MSNAEGFVTIVRQMVAEELNKMDRVIPCTVIVYNKQQDILDIALLTDISTIIRGVRNFSKFEFNSGDIAYVYLIQNRLSDSFIIGKQGGTIGSPHDL